jgi:hypothetical protein
MTDQRHTNDLQSIYFRFKAGPTVLFKICHDKDCDLVRPASRRCRHTCSSLRVVSLLYDSSDARLPLLLLDEPFLGIDAGRREVLLQFADRAGVDLVVATPELDGVTPALAASSTLLGRPTNRAVVIWEPALKRHLL